MNADSMVQMSVRRLGEAYDFWQEDTRRALAEGSRPETRELDHFKHASFITFWLRRLCPVNETFLNRSFPNGRLRRGVSEVQEHFLRCGNELCAFLIGLQICIHYEVMLREARQPNVVNLRVHTASFLQTCRLDDELLDDFVMILKHKNVSPHAIYIAFRSFFTNLRPA
jgi:hypothetical protein